MSVAGPTAANFIKFSELRKQRLNRKVRFFGCVCSYDTTTGEAVLLNMQIEHQEAVVDVNLLLETMDHSLLAYGQWVNVSGYVTKQETEPNLDGLSDTSITSVQAIMFWPTGATSIKKHTDAVEELRTVHGAGKMP